MWKFEDFSITQILREINFRESRRLQTAVFAKLRALNFVDLANLALKKCKKQKSHISKALNVIKWLILHS